MTKALLLLKELKKESVKRWYQGYIDNAISELKELSKPKNCEGCAYDNMQHTDAYAWLCNQCSYLPRKCNFTPKDTK